MEKVVDAINDLTNAIHKLGLNHAVSPDGPMSMGAIELFIKEMITNSDELKTELVEIRLALQEIASAINHFPAPEK